MIREWNDFLDAQGAVREEGVIARFGDAAPEARAATEADVIADLTHHGLISVRGAHAEGLLQGQLTNDISEVSETRSQLSAWCSPKGRVLVRFRVWKRDDAYFLEAPAGLVESTLERLRIYVLRAEVTLGDASREWVRIGVSGERAASGLGDALGALPEAFDAVHRRQQCSVIRLRGARPRFEIIGPIEPLRMLWERLRAIAVVAGAHAWRLLDIHAGVAELPETLSDAFLPQMLNLQAVNGLSFTKGCYAGQEVIARTEHLGRLKRRMYLARVEADEAPQPGDALYSSSAQSSHAAGTVVSASAAADGAWALLAVLRIDAVTAPDQIRLRHVLGPVLELGQLPYRVESQAA